ncbi:uncharacterized protein CC84DRAFT_908917 [Paraphaeosphaeria sporulosa]|uniref:Uncharacterized protein n=1 Tax=Paraphaeosphaeria sporulosa TaxID=1460663 RepID=A0A177C7D3_9PLEO|nr:uncharacterized protein CC84DRAFT_908917 [Paraphaeosphaeria sporulosa]OAG02657.1 hypothetical protein CC84DRAFT_908917 [Paraphaeosphaeria sporulosa]
MLPPHTYRRVFHAIVAQQLPGGVIIRNLEQPRRTRDPLIAVAPPSATSASGPLGTVLGFSWRGSLGFYCLFFLCLILFCLVCERGICILGRHFWQFCAAIAFDSWAIGGLERPCFGGVV